MPVQQVSMRKSAYAMPAQRICASTAAMADPLWGVGKTRIFIESERFTPTGASFVRKPAWWVALE